MPDKTSNRNDGRIERISADGQRYLHKHAGSIYSAGVTTSQVTRSCALCGTHRMPSAGRFKKLFGQSHFVCAPTCSAGRPESR